MFCAELKEQLSTFLQESYFVFCFGVTEAGCYGAIDVKTGDSYLFFPRYPQEYAVWMGPLIDLETFKKKYQVTYTHYVDEVKLKKNFIWSVTLKFFFSA